MAFYVYILSSKKYGTLYVGVTRNLSQRAYLHKIEFYEGFTKKYNVKMLVYYEAFDWMTDAIQREKNLKFWKRQWKIELIESMNPEWKDLYETLNW